MCHSSLFSSSEGVEHKTMTKFVSNAGTINEKMVGIIINNGNFDNLIAQNAVVVLKLKTKEHKKPYQISCIKHGEGVETNGHCVVKLSIGKKYLDEIICDIINMDVANLILGRCGNLTLTQPTTANLINVIHVGDSRVALCH